jgi:hypothetical protein
MARAGKKKPRDEKLVVANDEATTEQVISYPNVRFSRDRIEMLRDGKPVTAIDRKVVTRIVLRRASPSEHPIRETSWCLGLGLAGAFVLREAAESGKTISWILGPARASISACNTIWAGR